MSDGAVTDSKESVIIVKDRVCDYYISQRGCVKGENCDFLHPLAPSGAQTNRVCDFYSTPRGCIKSEKCDFLHPRRTNPRGEVSHRVCEYYLTPAGCLKGNQCDFLHPRVAPGGVARQMQTRQHNNTASAHSSNTRVCEFHNTPRGCIKGAACHFSHTSQPQSSNTSQTRTQTHPPAERFADGTNSQSTNAANSGKRQCDYFFTKNGCKKGEECPFAHHRTGAAANGNNNTNGNTSTYNSNNTSNTASTGNGSRVSIRSSLHKRPKVCDFYSTERGCVKGDLCEFIHLKDKICEYYSTAKGCRKGDLCDFKHPKDAQANTNNSSNNNNGATTVPSNALSDDEQYE